MKPRTESYLKNAALSLTKGRDNLGIGHADEAARHAYYAAFHAAHALIFERTGKAPRTHGGVASEFRKIARKNRAFTSDLLSFLSSAYIFKQTADYEAATAAPISPQAAKDALDRAEHIVKIVEKQLTP